MGNIGENTKRMSLKFKKVGEKTNIKNPILIEGLPGIGNVGKVAVDFIIENLKAKKIYEVYSHSFPHSVLVNEENIVELPKISLYHKKIKNKDIIFMVGDIQPIDEKSCYEFCESFLDLFEKMNGKEIITLGGIGLPNIPKIPKLYCTANNKKIINNYMKKTKLNNGLYGVVGPIIGVSGLLIGLSKERNIPAICILAETLGHPTYVGIKGARQILKALDKLFTLKLDFKRLDKEIKEIEKEILSTATGMTEVSQKKKSSSLDTVTYIG